MRIARTPFVLAAAIATPALAQGQEPAPDAKAECAAAYEQSQEKRKAGDLLGARRELAVCVRDVCPEFVRNECAGWSEEVEKSTPTVVLAARRGDEDLTGVRVLLDGELFASELTGVALAVNPGVRVFSFERAGEPAVERKVLVRVGEKNRRVSVSFASPESAAPLASAAEAPATRVESADEAKKRGQKRTIAYVLAGTSAAALGSFVVFGASGKSAENDLRDSCSPDCPQGDVDAVRTKYIVADISLAVSAVSLGAAAWFFLTSRPARSSELRGRRPELRFVAQPAPGGGFVGVSRRF